MTCIVAAIGKRAIWLGADRRLTYPQGRQEDNGTKITRVSVRDARALIGYAGLGMTPTGLQPSEWVARAVAKYDLTFLETLTHIYGAVGKEFPPLMKRFSTDVENHSFLVPTIWNDETGIALIRCEKARGKDGYNIDYGIITDAEGKKDKSGFGFALAGSGRHSLIKRRNRWESDLKKLVLAYDKGRVSPETVAKQISSMIALSSKADKFSSAECFVVWEETAGPGGFEHFGAKPGAYTGSVEVPAVANGFFISETVKQFIALPEQEEESHPLKSIESDPDGSKLDDRAEELNDKFNEIAQELHKSPKKKLR